MDNYFIWKGVSSAEMGLACSNPNVFVPQRNASMVTVPGRSGYLTVDDGSFGYVTKTVECRLLDNNAVKKLRGGRLTPGENQSGIVMDKLVPWLTGCGEVIFSDQPQTYYKACVNKAVPIEYILKKYRAFVVAFDCQPFKFNVNWKNDIFSFYGGTHTFYGQGAYKAEPVITVYGNGNIVLTVNEETINLAGINGHITVNTEIMDCYKDRENMNSRMSGHFPYLKESGQLNIISASGNVDRVEVVPNWRWL